MSLRRYLQKGMLSVNSCQLTVISLLFTIHCSLLTVFTGCGAKDEAVKPSLGYFDILPQMTKSKKVIDNMDSKLFISATYKNLALREAYVDEYARRYQMDNNQKEKLKEMEEGLDERFNEFFIAVYTPDERWNDFNQPQSIWKIYMENEKGNRVSPIEIKKADVASPLIREFYPYLDLWSSGYIVKFPKYMIVGEEPFPGKDANYFKLIITGVVGKAELEWQLK